MVLNSLKIGYLSSENPADKKVWSGTHYSILKSLERIGKVTVLGPFEPKVQLFIGKAINQLSLKLLKKRFDYRHSYLISKMYGKYFSSKIKSLDLDLIVAPAASCELAFVDTVVPVCYITDGTFDGCLNYHTALTNLLEFNINEGHSIEKRALEKSKYVVVSSEWAARSAQLDYQIPLNKIHVLPFGANFEKLPSGNVIDLSVPPEFKILFVGVYWLNKGGDIAFNAFKMLADEGYTVSMTVLGCIPPENISHPKLTVIPFIDKNEKQGQTRLAEIYAKHHVLILPTRFDCTPIVINEASAFGIPCLVANSGGVAGHLKDGRNGYLIDYKNQGDAYAKKIEAFIQFPLKYIALRKETRKLFEEELNWEHWIKELQKIFKG